ncbi:MAG: hypothetical protein AAF389_15145 [Gemmatimonadota bacterium]
MMCSDPAAVLSFSDNGSISRCPCCAEIEIAFGNAVLYVDAPELVAVGEAVDQLLATPIVPPGPKPYVLEPLPGQPVALAFSAAELFELSELVAVALEVVAGWEAAPQRAVVAPLPSTTADLV